MVDIKKKISELASSTAGQYGVQVVDVEMAGNSRKAVLRVFIDKKDGVTLEDCEKFSRALSAVLDVEDLIQSSYILEVSSPGLDRPLRSMEDFEMNVGKLARVITREGIENRNFFVGRILEVKDGTVALQVNEGQQIDIPFEKISKARLEIEFK
jgi:ribosome maturation factor RimP